MNQKQSFITWSPAQLTVASAQVSDYNFTLRNNKISSPEYPLSEMLSPIARLQEIHKFPVCTEARTTMPNAALKCCIKLVSKNRNSRKGGRRRAVLESFFSLCKYRVQRFFQGIVVLNSHSCKW